MEFHARIVVKTMRCWAVIFGVALLKARLRPQLRITGLRFQSFLQCHRECLPLCWLLRLQLLPTTLHRSLSIGSRVTAVVNVKAGGMRAHQRRCRTINALVGIKPNINLAAINCEVLLVNTNNDNIMDTSSPGVRPVPSLQPVKGPRLPRSREAWKEAHSHFLAYPPLASSLVNLDLSAAAFQEAIYSYFLKEYGLHKPRQPAAIPPISQLWSARRNLRVLKAQGATVDCTRRASS